MLRRHVEESGNKPAFSAKQQLFPRFLHLSVLINYHYAEVKNNYSYFFNALFDYHPRTTPQSPLYSYGRFLAFVRYLGGGNRCNNLLYLDTDAVVLKPWLSVEQLAAVITGNDAGAPTTNARSNDAWQIAYTPESNDQSRAKHDRTLPQAGVLLLRQRNSREQEWIVDFFSRLFLAEGDLCSVGMEDKKRSTSTSAAPTRASLTPTAPEDHHDVDVEDKREGALKTGIMKIAREVVVLPSGVEAAQMEITGKELSASRSTSISAPSTSTSPSSSLQHSNDPFGSRVHDQACLHHAITSKFLNSNEKAVMINPSNWFQHTSARTGMITTLEDENSVCLYRSPFVLHLSGRQGAYRERVFETYAKFPGEILGAFAAEHCSNNGRGFFRRDSGKREEIKPPEVVVEEEVVILHSTSSPEKLSNVLDFKSTSMMPAAGSSRLYSAAETLIDDVLIPAHGFTFLPGRSRTSGATAAALHISAALDEKTLAPPVRHKRYATKKPPEEQEIKQYGTKINEKTSSSTVADRILLSQQLLSAKEIEKPPARIMHLATDRLTSRLPLHALPWYDAPLAIIVPQTYFHAGNNLTSEQKLLPLHLVQTVQMLDAAASLRLFFLRNTAVLVQQETASDTTQLPSTISDENTSDDPDGIKNITGRGYDWPFSRPVVRYVDDHKALQLVEFNDLSCDPLHRGLFGRAEISDDLQSFMRGPMMRAGFRVGLDTLPHFFFEHTENGNNHSQELHQKEKHFSPDSHDMGPKSKNPAASSTSPTWNKMFYHHNRTSKLRHKHVAEHHRHHVMISLVNAPPKERIQQEKLFEFPFPFELGFNSNQALSNGLLSTAGMRTFLVFLPARKVGRRKFLGGEVLWGSSSGGRTTSTATSRKENENEDFQEQYTVDAAIVDSALLHIKELAQYGYRAAEVDGARFASDALPEPLGRLFVVVQLENEKEVSEGTSTDGPGTSRETGGGTVEREAAVPEVWSIFDVEEATTSGSTEETQVHTEKNDRLLPVPLSEHIRAAMFDCEAGEKAAQRLGSSPVKTGAGVVHRNTLVYQCFMFPESLIPDYVQPTRDRFLSEA
ncbi:unnamed protein product [Amoebophrya sp. A120]|nr:unnamed protein product [Amoebophrya sp. A120]|eukprot:GSA120T00018127001.1